MDLSKNPLVVMQAIAAVGIPEVGEDARSVGASNPATGESVVIVVSRKGDDVDVSVRA
jgi:hypothetical protein